MDKPQYDMRETLRHLYSVASALEFPVKCETEEGHLSHWDSCDTCWGDATKGHEEGCPMGDLFDRVRYYLADAAETADPLGRLGFTPGLNTPVWRDAAEVGKGDV